MGLPPIIRGRKIELRRWSEHRLDDLMAAIECSLSDLGLWLPWASPMPTREVELAVVRAAVARFDAGEDFAYFIVEPATDELVGCAGLHPKEPGRAEIGYWVRSDRHRRGYATDAAAALTSAALDMAGIEVVVIRMDAGNGASTAVARHLGYEQVAGDGFDPPAAAGATGVGLVWEMRRAGRPPTEDQSGSQLSG